MDTAEGWMELSLVHVPCQSQSPLALALGLPSVSCEGFCSAVYKSSGPHQTLQAGYLSNYLDLLWAMGFRISFYVSSEVRNRSL